MRAEAPPGTATQREIRVSDGNEAGSWEGILEPDEQIEWQGEPVRDLRWELPGWQGGAILATGLVGAGLWFAGHPTLGSNVLVLFAWGVIGAVLLHARSFWNRRRTFYTLSNRRAFIATWHFGVQRLKAYPLPDPSELRLVPSTPGHVFFAKDWVWQKGRLKGKRELRLVDVGFQNLADPLNVYELFLALQNRAALSTSSIR